MIIRYNYPLCEECNCNPDGVTEDFFALGGCDAVPEGSLCTCKENVEGRICHVCRPLFWNLQSWNPKGCEGKSLIKFFYFIALVKHVCSCQIVDVTDPEPLVPWGSVTRLTGSVPVRATLTTGTKNVTKVTHKKQKGITLIL